MPKILVIDDEELLTRTFVKLLEKEGYEVLIAKTGRDALEMAEEDSFDLVLCDIRMPGIDGVETVVRLREVFRNRGASSPPEIFITGYANPEIEERARVLQPAAYVLKPFDTATLLSKVKGILGR